MMRGEVYFLIGYYRLSQPLPFIKWAIWQSQFLARGSVFGTFLWSAVTGSTSVTTYMQLRYNCTLSPPLPLPPPPSSLLRS